MNLELTDSELDELKRLLCDFFLGLKKFKYTSIGKVLYESKITERYDFNRLFSMRSLLGKVLTSEELMKLEEDYRLKNWGKWFPD